MVRWSSICLQSYVLTPIQFTSKSLELDIRARLSHFSDLTLSSTGEWLAENSYSDHSSATALKLNKPLMWDATTISKSGGIPSFSYDEIINNEAALHAWLTELDFMGVTLIKGAPKERGVVSKLTNLVGYPRNTMYGLTWDVESIPNPNNVAYTSLPLPIHADLCYYEAPPGIQLLHCIKFEQKTGGENLFVDAFRVATDLEKADPDAYEVLCQLPTIFHKDDSQHLLKHGHTIIEVARHSGALKAINWSPPFEGVQRIPPGHVENYYKARKLWYNMLNDPKYAFQHRSEPGDVVVFNNRRVLHSRTEFDEKDGHRLLEGAYIGSDEFSDKLRALNRKFAPSANVHDGSGYTL